MVLFDGKAFLYLGYILTLIVSKQLKESLSIKKNRKENQINYSFLK